MSAYGAAKAAQDKLTQDLAFEFAPKGVRVNSILPGARTCRHMHALSDVFISFKNGFEVPGV